MHLKLKLYIFLLAGVISVSSCRPSYWDDKEEKEETENKEEEHKEHKENKEPVDVKWNEGEVAAIMSVARAEQENKMYSPNADTTLLYWLNNQKLILRNQTKCNIFALNTLYKAGFKTPKTNCLTYDMMDTSRFKDVFPVVAVSDPDAAKKGDLIIWNGHVIIFESLMKIKRDIYAMAWWAGTSQADNGDNIKNNVIYGKYKLRGYYLIRRPMKK